MKSPLKIRLITLLGMLGLVAIVAAACTQEGKHRGEDEFHPAPTNTPAVEQPADPTSEPVATTEPVEDPTEVPAIEDPTDLGIALELLAKGELDPNRFPDIAPGDGELMERLFPEAPPSVPHSVADIEITVDRNQCAECHSEGRTISGSTATRLPITHYTDALTGEVSADLDPRRYMCTSCHVPQVTDSPPYSK